MHILTGLIVLLCSGGIIALIFSAKECPHQDDETEECPNCGLINPKNSIRCDCGKNLILSPDTPKTSLKPCNFLSQSSNAKKLTKAGFILSSNGKIIAEAGIKTELEAEVAAAVKTIPTLGSDDADMKIIQAEGFDVITENGQLPFSDIHKEILSRIQQAVLDNYLTGRFQGNGGIIKYFEESLKMTPCQARLIARDQSGKIHGIVTMLRARKAGSIGYQWRTVKDARVRGNPKGVCPDIPARTNHWAREGKFYLWTPSENPPIAPNGNPFQQPPPAGHPGFSTLCRCTAAPIFKIGGKFVF